MRDTDLIAGYIVTWAIIAVCVVIGAVIAWAVVYPLLVMMMAAI